jgi:hypothetical protein
MGWVSALSWLAIALIAICTAIGVYAAWPERKRWNRRVSNTRVRQHQITVCLPTSWLKDFKDRDYE